MFLSISTERASPVRVRKFVRIFRRMARQPVWAGAAYGVPALAGRALPLQDGSIYCEIQCKTTSDRLKPGLHTLRPSVANEIFGLALAFLFLTARLGDAAPAGGSASLPKIEAVRN